MAEPINVVVDISHWNRNVDFAKLAEAGIIGVIQKATQGQTGVDFTYNTNKPKALAAGLLWGAYHFGTDSDGVAQAENFLQTVGDASTALLVLDFESNPIGPSMSLEEARAFVTHVNEKTGRFPGFYSGHDIKRALGNDRDPVLAQCWFWLAQYSTTPVVPANWDTWTLWQYTDGNFGPPPQDVAGIHLDRDKFNGPLEGLKRLWGVRSSSTPAPSA
ncbi:MAG: glycoside hydrolase family 25 protein [Methylocella sp.]